MTNRQPRRTPDGKEIVRVTIAPWSRGWGIFDADLASTRMYLTECGPFLTQKTAATAVKTLLRSDWTHYVIARRAS